jgi:hypothetical protein
MSENPSVVISFKDLEVDERLRESLEQRCQALTSEFPEVTRGAASRGRRSPIPPRRGRVARRRQ